MANQVTIQNKLIRVGDLIKVYQKIKEADKERLQVFEGIVIAIRGRDVNKSFTVRKISVGDIGVERIWPSASPHIAKIEIKKRGHVRRAKLYFLRRRIGKKAQQIDRKKVEKVKNEKKKSRKSGRKPGLKVPKE